MDSTIIVALPAVGEEVYKLSSEPVPHLTMLYLGELPDIDIPDVVTFVQHAAAHLDPFYLTVDYRGTLGDEQADVLFFENNMWEMPRLKRFRHQLLLNEAINRAYNSTEQFPEWQPHLTIGYPETPAKEPDDEDRRLHSVRFDRLAVWFGDYEGPEIRLKYNENGMDVAMSDISTIDRGASAVDELFHYGVKGMKWGVRTGDYEGASRATNREAAKDAKEFARAKMFYGQGAGTRRKLIKAKIEAKAKKDPTYEKAFDHHLAKQDLGKHASKARSERRRKDVVSETTKTARGVHRELSGGFGSTSLGSKLLAETIRTVSHAEDDEVVDFSSMTYDETMAHYGVKGMKWGVRNDSGHVGERAKSKKIAKVDKKFEKSIESANSGRASIALNNAVVSRINSRVKDLNDKYGDLDNASPAVRKKYDAESREVIMKSFEDGVREVYGSNASGTKKGVYNRDTDRIEIVDKVAKHANADTVPDFVAKITRDKTGKISNVALVELDENGAELKHYGVKGMKWGVTKNSDGTVTVNQTKVAKSLRKTDKAVTVTQRKAGTYVKTKGGQRQTASQDAIKTQAARQRAKRSTTDSLSTKELKDTIERMRLEQEFAKLDKKVSRKGQSFITRLLRDPELQEAVKKLKAANNAA